MTRKRTGLRILMPLVLPGFAAALMIASYANAEPQSYPMICHGGGEMSGAWTNVPRVIISFRKATASASQRPPGPGECAWLDRPMRADEPSHLWFSRWASRNPFSIIHMAASGVRVVGWDRRNPAVGPLQAAMSGAVFQVYVYQHESHRWFEVTRIGP